MERDPSPSVRLLRETWFSFPLHSPGFDKSHVAGSHSTVMTEATPRHFIRRHLRATLILVCTAAGGMPTAAAPVAPPPRHAAKVIVVNDDGFSAFFNGSYKSVDDVRQRILGYRDTPLAVLEWCVTGGSRVNYPSRVTELIGEGLTTYPRRGDQQVYDTLRRIADGGVNLTQAVADACHEAGLLCYASMRMNGDYAKSADGDLNQREFNSAFWWRHPEMRVRGPKGEDKTKLSYAFADVREFKLGILREVAACAIDGVNLDFLRHPPFLGYDEPLLRAFQEKYGEDARQVKTDDPRWLDLRAEVMTGFVRSVRALLDAAGVKQSRHLGLSVRVDWRELRSWGCDVERWIRAGWLDYVVVAQHGLGGYEFDLRPFVAMAAGTGCAVYFGEEALTSGHDLTAKEDRLLAAGAIARPRRGRLTTGQYAERAAKWYAMGADGVHLFNTHAAEDIRAAAGRPAK